MSIITEVRAIDAPNELNKDALDWYHYVFSNRIDYGYRINGEKQYKRILFNTYKGKMPKVLHNRSIERALVHKGNKQYCVSFNNKWDKELKKSFPNCLYGLLDIDDTSIYFNNLGEIDGAYEPHGIKICWYPSTVNEDGTINGYHGYIFFEDYQYYQRVSAALEQIAFEANLKISKGQLEIFPNVRANKNSALAQHRLPCQERFGATLNQFASDAMNCKSVINGEEIEALAFKFYKARKCRKANPSKWSREECQAKVKSLEWTSEGQTQDNVYLTAYYYRKELGHEWKDLYEKVEEVVLAAPGFYKHSKHIEDIDRVITNKVNYVIDRINPGWQVQKRTYTKRANKEKDLIAKVQLSIQNGATNPNQVARALGISYHTAKKYFLKLDMKSCSNITHTPSIKNRVRCVVRKSATSNIQNEISKLSKSELKSVLNTKGNVNVSKLAKTLGCHRKTIKLSKAELTIYITNLVKSKPSLTPITKSSTHPNKTDQITADKHKKVSEKDKEITSPSVPLGDCPETKDKEGSNQLQKYPYEDLIKAHKEEYKRKYKSILKTGNIDKLEKLTKKYEVLQLPNGRQHFI